LYSQPLDILDLIASGSADIALVAVTDIHGGTLRAKGALMAVTPDASYGYISAGCVDGDIIYQARQSLKDRQERHLIYGEGSPFKDITLPCGGSIHIRIIPNPELQMINDALVNLRARKLAILSLGDISLDYQPSIRLRLVGRGTPFTALANLAQTSGFNVYGQSPDQGLEQDCFDGFDHLTDPQRIPDIIDDPWTAVIFLFHDHDWEPALLRQALASEAFYIGAMGSERTHKLRIDALGDIKDTSRVRGPIGLIPAMRDAQMLAVSILAEIIDTARKQGRLV